MARSTAPHRPLASLAHEGLPAHPLHVLAALRPMQPHHELQPFREGEWLFEKRYCGMRMLALFGHGHASLRTRSGVDCSAWFPEVREALAAVSGGPYIVDGEIAAPWLADSAAHRVVMARMRQRGRRAGQRPVVYCVFDLLMQYGFDLLELPLEHRKRQLAALPLSDNGLMLVQPLHTGRLRLRTVMDEYGLQAVVAKRLDSRYEPGRRSPSWILVERPPAACGSGTEA